MGDERGLSPVIATILLVGLVVVSGTIIFTWIRGLTQESVIKFDQNIQLVCGNVEFEAIYSETDGKIDVSNTGNVPIYDFQVKLSDTSGGFLTKKMREYPGWTISGLNVGGAVTIDSGTLDYEEIVLTPILAGTAQSGSQASFTCDEAQYGKVISS
ncbi:hypothetical protein HY449_04545 [Candidatus Pacearchaeota archaeon]|nr:hypothetical protein [Candidatus Pacearchaeota archaeon]